MKPLFVVLLLILLLAVPAAQTFRGAINGTATDPSGAVVPGAHVKATNKATGLDYASESTSDGNFVFQDLPVGTYQVALRADSGCGAAIGIEQSKNLGLTAAYGWG